MVWKKDILAITAVFGFAEGLVAAFDLPQYGALAAGTAFSFGIAFARLYVAAVGAENTRVDDILDNAEEGLIQGATTLKSKEK